jgi:signal transduction histidine kinase/phage shock protein PspC (stress-responsive transcriptional regulator)
VETHAGRLVRSSTDRVVLGVAGGVGERIGVDPIVVRLGFGLLVLAGGIGFVLYLIGILVSVDPDAAEPGPAPRRARLRPTIAFASVLAGVLLVLRQAGLWFGDDVVWPMALGAIGSAVLWSRAELGRSRAASFVARGRGAPVRTVVGVLLIGAGVSLFVASGRRSGLLANAPVAAGAALVGVVVIVGPWVGRLVRQLADERRERIRSQERAAISAHLHDSVLQTLAMIQRADDPRRMSNLARTQERELRSWLYGRTTPNDHPSVSGAIDSLVDQIEREHAIAVEAVSVGDASIDDEARALLAAAREALVNAAQHSGATVASLFVEIEPQRMSVYVRDQGAGFDRASVGADRRGIADSIEGRIRSVGGSAEVVSTPGSGTEVRITVPRSVA